jgi:hypothetical protein
MSPAFDPSDLPGPPSCCLCGTEDATRYVGGYGYQVCADCLALQELADPVPEGATCALCGLQIGDRSPWLGRRAVVAAICHDGIVLCARCRHISRTIVIA